MSEKRLLKVSSGTRGNHRTVFIEIDRHYVVKPTSKRKLKHRDRECVVLDVVLVNPPDPIDKIAKVRFLDNNRQGRVDLTDLVPLGDLYEEEVIDQ